MFKWFTEKILYCTHIVFCQLLVVPHISCVLICFHVFIFFCEVCLSHLSKNILTYLDNIAIKVFLNKSWQTWSTHFTVRQTVGGFSGRRACIMQPICQRLYIIMVFTKNTTIWCYPQSDMLRLSQVVSLMGQALWMSSALGGPPATKVLYLTFGAGVLLAER